MTYILPLVLIIAMMYWMTRQQKKQQQRQADMQAGLKKGTKVVTIGGMHATVDKVNEAEKTVDLNANDLILTFDITAIRTAQVEKAEEVKSEEKTDDKAEEVATETKDSSEEEK